MDQPKPKLLIEGRGYPFNTLGLVCAAADRLDEATAPAEPPKDGEVAALIERHRKLHKVLQENGSLTFHWYASETASGENDWTFKETADALARLSAPVPDKEK